MKGLMVAIAGAAGALSRYGLGLAVEPRSFPWSTLGINVGGSFLFGLVLRAAVLRGWSDVTTAALTVGFLGAFTTFSTFAYETTDLLRAERSGAAAAYVTLSLAGSLVAAAIGYSVARSIA